MRVLVAGRNAKVLATTAGAFSNDLTIETASTKAASIALLERMEFDLIVACETLGDGSGLEVLSHAAVNTPNALRIFAARPSTLKLLQGELGFFGLFRTLPYPINFRKLWAAINLARSCCAETEPGAKVQAQAPAGVAASNGAAANRGAVAANGGAPGSAASGAAAATGGARASATSSAAPGVAVPSRQAQEPRRAAQARANATAQQAKPPQTVASHATAASRPAPTSRRDTRIPESEAFKRALARRNAAKLDPNTHISAAEVLGTVPPRSHASGRGDQRREPAMSGDSLAQLARLATTRRPIYESRSIPGGKKRTAIFVGSGIFAAATAAGLTFLMLNSNNSIGHTKVPLVASVDGPTPQKVFAWEAPAPEQPASEPPPPVGSEAPTAAAADLEVQAEADSDASSVEPGHPGPPQPNPPPGPFEPPSADSPGWVDE